MRISHLLKAGKGVKWPLLNKRLIKFSQQQRKAAIILHKRLIKFCIILSKKPLKGLFHEAPSLKKVWKQKRSHQMISGGSQ